jgi:hypothetical protein
MVSHLLTGRDVEAVDLERIRAVVAARAAAWLLGTRVRSFA